MTAFNNYYSHWQRQYFWRPQETPLWDVNEMCDSSQTIARHHRHDPLNMDKGTLT